MFEIGASSLLSYLWLTFLAKLSVITVSAFSIAKPGCPTTCGNVIIRYPFGIGLDGECSLSKPFNINCDTSFDPPKPFLGPGNLEIVDIFDDGEMRIANSVVVTCYQGGVKLETGTTKLSISLIGSAVVFSDRANKMTVIGCDDIVLMGNEVQASGCFAMCTKPLDVVIYNGSCTGIGCCQTAIPKGLKSFSTSTTSIYRHINVSDYNPCGVAFLAEERKFTFNVADLSDPLGLRSRTVDSVSIVLDWFVGVNETCDQARNRTSMSSYACQENTNCTDFIAGSETGYRCSCLPGYQGNPYLSHGCTDIDECAHGSNHDCSHICTNTVGSYKCSCPKGYIGDGLKQGTRCVANIKFIVKLSLGLSAILGALLLLVIGWWLNGVMKKRNAIKQRAKNIEKNGGLLLQHQMSSDEGAIQRTKIFTIDELEVVISSQINHRNIVKLLGCCLESEVPLLVFEFIPNGTLYNHMHYPSEEFPITWRMRMQIASDSAEALAYLHSSSSVPIFHRDIKSSNILLDDKYRAKLSDFGTSKYVGTDQTHITTRVMGTFGYLDPGYFQSSQFTEKSDVYSFGVVLVELLTGQKAISATMEEEEDRSLVLWFLSHIDLDGRRRPTMKEVLLVLETAAVMQCQIIPN